MGKKTRPFIDKKTASVYHVVRRSQRDVGTEATAETLSDFVLMPSPDNPPPLALVSSVGNVKVKSVDGNNKKKTSSALTGIDFQTLEATIAAAGLLDETAKTYAKYTKPIQNSGTYISASTTTTGNDTTNNNLDQLLVDTSRNELDDALQEAMAVHEVGRMLDSIALTPDCMEEDIALALFGNFDEGNFEEMDDDFCITANQEVLLVDEDDNDKDDDEKGGFDFEKHVQMLLEKARAQENGGGTTLKPNDDYFKGAIPLHGRIDEEGDEEDDDFDYDRYDEEEEDDESDYDEEEDSLDREFNNGMSSAMTAAKNTNTEEQRILCQKFEEALLEYDSDDMGDLDDECDDIGGNVPLEGDAGLEAALNEYLTEREDDILIEGTVKVKRAGGSGYSALVGRTMVNASALDDHPLSSSTSLLVNVQESKRQMALDMAEADAILANPEMDLPPEEVFIDGKSYFSVTSRNPWDCESILSTYSNLDNNPVIIGRSDRRRKNKGSGGDGGSVTSNDIIPEDGPVKIKLSNKTGLPLRSDTYGGVRSNNNGVHDDYDDDEGGDYFDNGSTYLSINRGEARHKNETLAEKKERKMAIKEERKICRIQKKMMKEAFAEEFQRRGQDVILDPVGGNTVFRFS
jgi:protein LTV1